MEIKIGDVISFKDLANENKTGRVTKIDIAFNGVDIRYHLDDLNNENVRYCTIQDKITEKSKLCKRVLELMDQDFSYQEALSVAITELEKELDQYI